MQTAPTTPTPAPASATQLLPPISSDPIFVAYPPDKYSVAYDHVLLEGSVLPGATFSIGGQAVDVGADGLFIE